MAAHSWNGHTIDVALVMTPRALWLSSVFVVTVDGSAAYQSPKHFEGFRSRVPFAIQDAGGVRQGWIQSGVGDPLYWPYRIYIDEMEIARGATRAANWHATYVVYAALIVLLVFGIKLIFQ